MNKKKGIAVAIVLALILLIGGTIAFFTDTDTATNEFTLGDEIEISLSETWNSQDGIGIHPGTTVTKAPSIVNDSQTTPAYVFAEIIVPCYDIDADGTVETPLFSFTTNAGWTQVGTATVDTDDKTITYVYAYGNASAMTSLAANSTTTTAVFNSVTLAPTLTAAQKATAPTPTDIVVNAYGIQTDNVGTTPTQVWTNLNQ